MSPYQKGKLFRDGWYSVEQEWVDRKTYDHVCAQREVAKVAAAAAISKAEYQSRTNQELNAHLARIEKLETALRWYADHLGHTKSLDYRIIVQDAGAKAREALQC